MRSLALLLVASTLGAQAPPLTLFQQHKAQALLSSQLPCLGCHELSGQGGRIGPSLTDVSQRRDAEYISAIITDPQRIVPGAAMPKTPMTRSTRELIIAYVARNARAGAVPATAPPSSAPPATTAAATYGRWCSSCHGATGHGDGPNAKYLPVPPAVHSSASQMGRRSDDALFDAIAGGGVVMGKSPRMPAFGETLSASEIRGLVAHIRTLCACKAPAWSSDGSR
jgi:mono/diheme cytochrome c family protein